MAKWARERTCSMADLTVSGQALGRGILGVLALADMVLVANQEVWNQKMSVPLHLTEEPAASKRYRGPILPVLSFSVSGEGWGIEDVG